MNLKALLAKQTNFLSVLLFLQVVMVTLIVFDIPVARQVFGFVYLTFIPGFIIVKLLKLKELNKWETIFFSIGFSVAFLMIIGLIINELGLILGLSSPLSLIPLLVIFNSVILLAGVVVFFKSDDLELFGSKIGRPSLFALFSLVLLILCVVGTFFVNVFGNNIILLVMIVAISVYFIIALLSNNLSSQRAYPVIILVISFALLFHAVLISNYLISFGSDIPFEAFLAETTKNSGQWSSAIALSVDPGLSLNSMLSVTILPTIYSTLLNIDVPLIFKVVIPLIFSFLPLGLYQLWQGKWKKTIAFIAAFLFMAQATFYTEMLGLGRQMIAEIFFVLLLMVIFNQKLVSSKKITCFFIFSVALVVSHYALAEFFFAFIIICFIVSVWMKWPDRKITLNMIIFFGVVMFMWYIFTSNALNFDRFVDFGNYLLRRVNQFFNLESRGTTVLTGLGLTVAPSVWNAISRAFSYITQALIVVGFGGLIIKRTKIHLDKEYFVFSLIALAFLGLIILVPGLATSFNVTRFYHILLFFLAPLCALGVVVLFKKALNKQKEIRFSLILIVILVPYLLFQTGFVYEVTRSDSWSLPLSGYRMDGSRLYNGLGYIDDVSVTGAQWLKKNVDVEKTQIYADLTSRYDVLTSYGHIYRLDVELLSNTTREPINGIIYLNPFNTFSGIVADRTYFFPLSDLYFLNETNVVYSNGGSEIYLSFIND